MLDVPLEEWPQYEPLLSSRYLHPESAAQVELFRRLEIPAISKVLTTHLPPSSLCSPSPLTPPLSGVVVSGAMAHDGHVPALLPPGPVPPLPGHARPGAARPRQPRTGTTMHGRSQAFSFPPSPPSPIPPSLAYLSCRAPLNVSHCRRTPSSRPASATCPSCPTPWPSGCPAARSCTTRKWTSWPGCSERSTSRTR